MRTGEDTQSALRLPSARCTDVPSTPKFDVNVQLMASVILLLPEKIKIEFYAHLNQRDELSVPLNVAAILLLGTRDKDLRGVLSCCRLF